MLLAIDIGNTNIKSALFSATKRCATNISASANPCGGGGFAKNCGEKGNKIVKQFEIPTKTYSKVKFAKKLSSKLEITDVAICSVVPKLTRILKRDLKLLTGKTPYIIGKDLIVPMKNLYRNPKQLGQDRLAGAYAASNLYKPPLIVIGSGTVITFDAVSGEKAYLGGLIFPGMKISLEALGAKTALLPKLKLQRPKTLIGDNTKNSILSGIVFGTAFLAKEVAARIKRRIGREALIIGTGGNIRLIKKYSGIRMKIDTALTLKGINLIYGNRI